MRLRLGLFEVLLGLATIAFVASKCASESFANYFFRLLPFSLAAYTVFWSWLYPFYVSPLRHVPTVPGFPLWGQFKDIITREVGVPQRDWHKRHGSIIRYFFPFGYERLSIADDDALRHLTVHNAYNYPKPLRAKLWMLRILGEGVLLAEGDEHIRQRKALNPAFSIQSIKNLSPWFWRKGLHLAEIWHQEFPSDVKTRSFEVLEWLNRTTLDIIGQAAFGTEINSLDYPQTPLREAYRLVFAFDLGSRILHGLQSFIPATKHIPSKMNSDMQASREIIVNEATRIIESKHCQSERESKDIISLIVRDNEKAKPRGEQLSFESMRDQVMTFLGAGHDTTATGVAWTLHLLSKHSDVQTKLREEIREYMPQLFDSEGRGKIADRWEDFDVDRLPYLDNVCRESLRYIPPIPMTVREAKADDVLGGYFIPKGTTVYVLANAINRLPQYWGDTADEFVPERWDKLPPSFTPNAYMTFLQGPRGCIGRKFAEIEMKVILCCLLSVFKFSILPDIESPEDLKMWRLVLRPRDGITLNATLLA